MLEAVLPPLKGPVVVAPRIFDPSSDNGRTTTDLFNEDLKASPIFL